jgi:hypothetical protein
VMVFANVGFAAFAYLLPLAQTSKLKMHMYNADGCCSAGKCPPQAQLLCDQHLVRPASTYTASTYTALFCVCNLPIQCSSVFVIYLYNALLCL